MTDDWLGKFLDRLHDLNLERDTVIALVGDHGILLGEHGWTGKISSALYPALTRVPLILVHPHRRRAGQESPWFASTHDVAPTLLSMAGVRRPHRMTGPDLSRAVPRAQAARARLRLRRLRGLLLHPLAPAGRCGARTGRAGSGCSTWAATRASSTTSRTATRASWTSSTGTSWRAPAAGSRFTAGNLRPVCARSRQRPMRRSSPSSRSCASRRSTRTRRRRRSSTTAAS